MSERMRNVAVGLTVIVALAMLAGMILLFAGLPEIFQSGYVLRLGFSATGGVNVGDMVHLEGMSVGRVIELSFQDNDPRKGVQITVRINRDVRLPANVVPRIHRGGLVGTPYVELSAIGPPRVDPRTGKELVFLPKDWPEPLKGTMVAGGLVPPELLDAFDNLSKLAKSIDSLIAPPAATQPAASQPAATQPAEQTTLKGTLAKLGRALDAVEATLGNPQNQQNIRKSLAGVAEASAKAAEAMDALKAFAQEATKVSVDTRATIAAAGKTVGQYSALAEDTDRQVKRIAQKLITSADDLSAMLTSLNKIATKVDQGEGTAGRLINDPKLYDSLLGASEQFARLTAELRGLLEDWKKAGGVPLKLK